MYLTFKKDGMFVEITDDNGTTLEPLEKFKLPISYYLGYNIEFDQNLKFRDLLNVLSKYRDQFAFLYSGYLKYGDFKDIFEPTQKGDDEITSKIKEISFIWETETIKRKTEPSSEIDVWSGCVGLDKKEVASFVEIKYVDFTSDEIYHLLDKPVYIDSYIEFGDIDYRGKYFKAISGYRRWTLNDLLLALISLTVPIIEEPEIEESSDEEVEVLESPQISDIITGSKLLDILDEMEK